MPQLTKDQVELLRQPIVVLQLQTRTVNALEDAGVYTVRDLLHCCAAKPGRCKCQNLHLLNIPNFGAKTVRHVFECLAAYGFVSQGGDRENNQSDAARR